MSPRLTSSFPTLTIPAGPRYMLRVAWVIALAAIVVLSLHPKYGPPGAFQLDKLAHTFGYGILAVLPFTAFISRRTVLWAAVAMLPLGIVLEGLQSIVPGRHADTADAAFNALGVGIGLILGPASRRLANRTLGRAGTAPKASADGS